MSWQAVEAVIEHSTMHGAPYAVQLVIAEAIIQGCTETSAQQSYLAERSHLSLGEFRRQCQKLVSLGELCCKRHGRRPNSYSFPWYTMNVIRLNSGEQERYSPEFRRTEDAGYSPEPRRSQTAWVQANKSAVPYSGNPDPGDNSAHAHAREGYDPENLADVRRWQRSREGKAYLFNRGMHSDRITDVRYMLRQWLQESEMAQ